MKDERLNTLILKRFCGEEYYRLQNASWSIWNGSVLCVEMWFAEGTNLHEDTEYLEEEPGWELYFNLPEENEDCVKTGMVLTDTENREEETHFYYCEHLPTVNNRLEILDTDGTRLLLRITGECCDVNYYDGSKGNNSLELTAWIDQE